MLEAVLISLAVVSAAVLLVLVVALLRHLRAVAGAVQDLQSDLQPILQELQASSERTRDRLDRIARSQESHPG